MSALAPAATARANAESTSFTVQEHVHGRAANGFRRRGAHFRRFVGEHQQRITELHFGVRHLAVGCGHRHPRLCSERLGVELHRTCRVAAYEVRCDRAIALWNRLDLFALSRLAGCCLPGGLRSCGLLRCLLRYLLLHADTLVLPFGEFSGPAGQANIQRIPAPMQVTFVGCRCTDF